MRMQLGSIQVTIVNVCELRADLASWFGLASWPEAYDGLLRQAVAVPAQCVLIQTQNMTLLVDAYEYDLAPDSSFALPNYQPPPGLITQLAEMDVLPADITHVVITHLHFDHYTGVTRAENGGFVPTFPKAKVYIGRSDWQLAESQFARPNSPESRTLLVLQENGLVELVSAELMLSSEITILPAPGESPGHQVVRLTTPERNLYILGDLYHHEVEVEQPEWIVRWADHAGMQASRRALLPELLDEQSVLVAAHIGGFGRLHSKTNGLYWQKINLEER